MVAVWDVDRHLTERGGGDVVVDAARVVDRGLHGARAGVEEERGDVHMQDRSFRNVVFHGKYHGESVPDETYFPRSMNSAGERTGGPASASWSRWASPETMHCAPATRASATR